MEDFRDNFFDLEECLDLSFQDPTFDKSTIIPAFFIALPFVLAAAYLAYHNRVANAMLTHLGLNTSNDKNNEQVAKAKKDKINAILGQAIVEALEDKVEKTELKDETNGETITSDGMGDANTGNANGEINDKKEVVAELQRMVAQKKRDLAQLVALQNVDEADTNTVGMKNDGIHGETAGEVNDNAPTSVDDTPVSSIQILGIDNDSKKLAEHMTAVNANANADENVTGAGAQSIASIEDEGRGIHRETDDQATGNSSLNVALTGSMGGCIVQAITRSDEETEKKNQ